MTNRMPNILPQSLKTLKISNLKGLHNLEIDFQDKEVMAIFGVNGSGKTTILHVLACLFKQHTGMGENNRFPRFFKRINGLSWRGSSGTLTITQNGSAKVIQFGNKDSRWTPRMDRRQTRDVVYIGIDSCVPDIEKEPVAKTKFSINESSDIALHEILTAASQIMNIPYTGYTLGRCGNKSYRQVQTNELRYYSLTMGAGEQRLFAILEHLYRMPAYSLLLIDELDLTLHTSAVQRLIDKMV